MSSSGSLLGNTESTSNDWKEYMMYFIDVLLILFMIIIIFMT